MHIYYFQENGEQKTFAMELWERIRRECEFVLLSLSSTKLQISFVYVFFFTDIGLTTAQSLSSASTSSGSDQLGRTQ